MALTSLAYLPIVHLDHNDIAAARTRAFARRAIAEALRLVPTGEWRNVLAEVLAEIDDEPALPVERSPTTATVSMSMTDRLLSALRERPGLMIGELAGQIYGSNDRDTHNRVRSMLSTLHRQGRVRALSRGQWEVVPVTLADASPKEKRGCRVLIEQVLAEHPDLGTEELIRRARELESSANPQTINTALSRLVQTRVVVRSGSRAGHYRYRLARPKSPNSPSGTAIVREIIANNPGLRAPQIIQRAEAAGIDPKEIHTVLYRLKGRGEVVGTGPRGRTTYTLAASTPAEDTVEEVTDSE